MIINADILEWAASYDGPLFHAVLCDAPYEMEFMGKSWDNSGIAFNPETWRLIARCLHPGAFLFVFAGTINDDLISVAMRQAGLRKYHKSMVYGYGSGFPKATNLPAQIDERAFQQWLAGHEDERTILIQYRDAVQTMRAAHKANPTPTSRALVTAAHNAYRRQRQEIKKAAGFLKTSGTRRHQPKFDAKGFAYREKDNGYKSKERETFDVTVPATDLAQTWDGYSYGGQMLKPALESLLIFQKPYQGAPVDCITRTGAGALWIDGSRIGTEQRYNPSTQSPHTYGGFHMCEGFGSNVEGRWPANLLLSHSPDCNGACAPDCPVRRLGEQSGENESKRSMRGLQYSGCFGGSIDTGPTPKEGTNSQRGHDDSGTAARYFFQADYMYERLEAADPLFYCAKADRAEREAGLDPRQVALLGMEEVEEGESERISQNSKDYTVTRCPEHGESIPSGSTSYRCGCPILRGQQYFTESTINDGRQKPIDNPYQRGETTRRNLHPTIKPLSLCRYLATLLLPPALYAPRRLLVPFSGAASEYIGALLAGWEEIVGVELEADYCRIAEARAAYWAQRRHEFLDPSKPIAVKLDAAPDGQLDMFMGDI